MSSTGVVEHLDKTPERWAFLLRIDDGSALNVELRGKVYGTLADSHEVELVESRRIEADEVIVARRMRNLTLGSMVTARQPGLGGKVVAFMVPQSIWTPIGGVGAAVFGYFTAGAAGDDANNAQAPHPTATPTGTATATPEPAVPADNDGFSPLVIVIAAVVILVAAITLVAARRRDEPEAPPPPRARAAGGGRVGWYAFVIVVGAIVGVGINFLIT